MFNKSDASVNTMSTLVGENMSHVTTRGASSWDDFPGWQLDPKHTDLTFLSLIFFSGVSIFLIAHDDEWGECRVAINIPQNWWHEMKLVNLQPRHHYCQILCVQVKNVKKHLKQRCNFWKGFTGRLLIVRSVKLNKISIYAQIDSFAFSQHDRLSIRPNFGRSHRGDWEITFLFTHWEHVWLKCCKIFRLSNELSG